MQFKHLEVGQIFRFRTEPENVVHMKISPTCLRRKVKHKPNYVVLAGRPDVGTASDANPDVGVEVVAREALDQIIRHVLRSSSGVDRTHEGKL